MYPEIPLPPKPILTRWGTWLEAVEYYAEHIDSINNVLLALDSEDAVSIDTAKTVTCDISVKNDLAHIQHTFSCIIKTLKSLQNRHLSLSESFEIINSTVEQLNRGRVHINPFPGHYTSVKFSLLYTMQIKRDDRVHLKEILKSEVNTEILKQLSLETINIRYPPQNWLHLYTDGSLISREQGAGAGVTCCLFSLYRSLGYGTTSFDGEIIAISESLRNLLCHISKFKNAVILSDSKAAILSIVSKHIPSSQTAEITKMLSQLISLNKRIVFQWIPSHCGILGNENADALAKKGSTATYRPVTKSTLITNSFFFPAGTADEKRYVDAILPIRKNGNQLLCTLVLANVLCNSTYTVILDSLTNGLVAIVLATCSIVVLAEILPQAVCTHYGLLIGAKTIYITRFFMILMFPLAYPIGHLLTWLLGGDVGVVYTRDHFMAMLKVAVENGEQVSPNEVNIISGAFDMKTKTVGEIMTPIDKVYMLNYDDVLDFDTVMEIVKEGFTRIPVYKDNRQNIVSVLFSKDLAFIDTDDKTPVSVFIKYHENPCHFVMDNVTLDAMFKHFKKGMFIQILGISLQLHYQRMVRCDKGHLAFVKRLKPQPEELTDEVTSGTHQSEHEVIGIITLEDILEELVQEEIMDETEAGIIHARYKKYGFPAQLGTQHEDIQISSQLKQAAFQYLRTLVDPFKSERLSEACLHKLLSQNVIKKFTLKSKKDSYRDSECFLYTKGKQADYFILILEGRVEVTVGQEDMSFESGPFSYFGVQALKMSGD
ncbi:hypothetical protein ANN_18482 [Periplaneta americana]|uniref:Uncharacterized protein n=1 Tax=Periplaneta americana TaxID=6978 RepID=A0ABQ8SQD0_PERAM|nr:hypothetical protein ANN_18482 [Periplaneta americana]